MIATDIYSSFRRYLIGLTFTPHCSVSLRVYNVSASLQHENETFQLMNLSPGQDYEVWINALTKAGPGEKTTARFKTRHHEPFGMALS